MTPTVPRTMYDAISANAAGLVAKNPGMVAIYLTGSPDIRWTSKQVALLPNVVTWVRIDQAGATAPQHVANVMDVEPGCYRPSDVPGWTAKCTAPRPTVYCDRSDLPAVMKVWKGDIWLAAPGLSLSECQAIRANNPQVVAVQNVFGGTFDSSVVLDEHWPLKAPIVPPPPPPPATRTVTLEYYKPGFGWVAEPVINVPGNTPRVRVRLGNGAWATTE